MTPFASDYAGSGRFARPTLKKIPVIFKRGGFDMVMLGTDMKVAETPKEGLKDYTKTDPMPIG